MYEDAHLESAYEQRTEIPDFYGSDFEIPEADPDLEDCDYCGEQDGGPQDPLAEWATGEKTDSKGFVTKMAHGQCGEDAGWTLA